MIVDCFQCFLTLNFHTATEICQSQITAFFRNIAFSECKCTNWNSCFFKSRVFKLNQRFNRCIRIQIFPHFLITLNEHPYIRSEESAISVCSRHGRTFDHKSREHITLIVCIIILHKTIEFGIHLTHASIRRIRNRDPILSCHSFAKVDELCQLLGGVFHTGTFQRDLHLIVNATYKSAQQYPVILRYIEDGAVLLGIGQDIQQTLQLHFGGVLFQVRKARPKKLEVSPVDGVAFLNGVDVAGVFAVEDAAVVLPCFHHHGKVCQLIGTVINVQTVEVVFQNALGGIPLAVTHAFVDLHQHVKGIDQNMPGTHAGVDKGQVFRVQGGVLLADRRQLCLYLRLLRGFVQIVLPVSPQVAVRVTLYPQAAKAVFNHIANCPVRCINSCSCR